ncbi:MAG: hypothetical protein PHP01_08985 [Phycisphaerae bacterium]|nr:hypothetical protein [Phycisphaerae bacterium]
MYRTELDHCEVVLDSLNGSRTTDEQTFDSMGILSERLESLRKLHRCFIDVEFSPIARALAEQESKMAVS